MSLRLTNTLTREVEELAPMDGERFRFYCCGPTVYAPAHVGNFRTFVIQDVLRRCLEVAGLRPYHVRNLTDVDDKTIRDSQAANEELGVFTARWTERFHEDCERLNCLPPHEEPRATEHIGEQIAMIEALLEKGHAYERDGSVYFRIESFDDYGRLSRVKERELRLGAASDADETDEDTLADFVLWKAWKEADGPNRWDSPWGPGRPGWHLECSAMSHKYLGETFDLHGGGVDLQFPHHENEIAQSVCCFGGEFARHWFHSEHLVVDGGKMSKSLGNFFTLDDIEAAGFHALELRYALLAAHYRQSLNFVSEGGFPSLQAASGALHKIARLKKRLGIGGSRALTDPSGTAFGPAWEALCDDLNVPRALGELFSAEATESDAEGLYAVLYALGLEADLPEPEAEEAPPGVVALAERRRVARAEKNWAEADALRDEIAAAGWTVKDTADGFELGRG